MSYFYFADKLIVGLDIHFVFLFKKLSNSVRTPCIKLKTIFCEFLSQRMYILQNNSKQKGSDTFDRSKNCLSMRTLIVFIGNLLVNL